VQVILWILPADGITAIKAVLERLYAGPPDFMPKGLRRQTDFCGKKIGTENSADMFTSRNFGIFDSDFSFSQNKNFFNFKLLTA
jgi:hypothetical protein